MTRIIRQLNDRIKTQFTEYICFTCTDVTGRYYTIRKYSHLGNPVYCLN